MNIRIQTDKFKPEDLHYDQDGLWVGDHCFPCPNPRLEFARALSQFDTKISFYQRGQGTIVASNTVIDFRKVSIGNNCTIGGQGFGYEITESGEIIQMPHLGNVIIEDGVALHNSVCIDRAVVGSTVVGAGTKIDNMVHVAHGVKIGRNCLIVSGTVFGGSCEIGDYTFIGINASVKQKVKIGRNCVIGAGAVITRDIPDNQIWVGNPGRFLKNTEPRDYPV